MNISIRAHVRACARRGTVRDGEKSGDADPGNDQCTMVDE